MLVTTINPNIDSRPISDHECDQLFGDYISDGACFAVAVSGGVDSMALACVAERYAKRHHCHCVMFTVDHGLRPNSRDEAQAVHDFLVSHDVEHTILTWQHDGIISTKIQEHARVARYHLLEQACSINGASLLMMGHHQEDQVETFLMRLNHRSGVKGLSSMRRTRALSDGILFRPFLNISKERLIGTLEFYGWPHWRDPSNENIKFERVRMRQSLSILQHNADLKVDNICASIQKLQALDDFMDMLVSDFFMQHSPDHFPLSAFQSSHRVLQQRLLIFLLHRFSPLRYRPPDHVIDKACDDLMRHDFKGATIGLLYLKRSKGSMVRCMRRNDP